MERRWKWTVGLIAGLVAAVLLPGLTVAAGPVHIANGEPDGDVQLSVLSPAEAAFMQKKLAMAAAVHFGRAAAVKPAPGSVAMYYCEYEPCEDHPTFPAPPPPPAPSIAKTLGTKARQQNNYYFCGPASGQVVVNWTRGITSGNNDGEDPTTNWKRQSKIAEWMHTTTAGTGGANLAVGLNNPNGVVKPTSDWIYAYAEIGTTQEFWSKVVTDIDGYAMPLVLATAPHLTGAGSFYLESWPNVAPGAHHWIVVRGYDGTAGQILKYQDSSGAFGGATGAFDDSLAVMWQVSVWNQGGHVVW
jgi:hypothetical protein